jgi:hypothetical protein
MTVQSELFKNPSNQKRIDAPATKTRKNKEVEEVDIVLPEQKVVRLQSPPLDGPPESRQPASDLDQPKRCALLEAIHDIPLGQTWIPETDNLAEILCRQCAIVSQLFHSRRLRESRHCTQGLSEVARKDYLAIGEQSPCCGHTGTPDRGQETMPSVVGNEPAN